MAKKRRAVRRVGNRLRLVWDGLLARRIRFITEPLSDAQRSARMRARRAARLQVCETWRAALERIATLADGEVRQIAVALPASNC
jgi:hypothetical protein